MKKIFYFSLVCFSSCVQDVPVDKGDVYKTKNVIIVVMDGARYSETWGHSGKQYIPRMRELASQGVICTSFYNEGLTSTVPGHTAITTGIYQNINNAGQEIPLNPSIFQYYLNQHLEPPTDAWIFASKDKLEVLSDCLDPSWTGKFRPKTDCGVNGNQTGYREDSITFSHLIDTLEKYHPHLVLVNFKEPDMSGHANDWLAYVDQIKKIDEYVWNLWNFIESEDQYKGTTSLIVTNDHGRHSDGVDNGFVSHWGNCEGCRHIFFFGIGPDFKKNHIDQTFYSQIDIAPTVGKIMNISIPDTDGKVMQSILK